MKKEDMYTALSGVAEKYIEEAHPRRRRRAPLAACACILAFALIVPVAVGWLTRSDPAVSTPADGGAVKANDPDGEIVNLSADIEGEERASSELDGRFIAASRDFAAELLKNSISGEKNTLLCPVSAMYALSMTANGARGQTLAQLESAMGGLSTAELNDAFNRLKSVFASHSKPITAANSVWYRNSGNLDYTFKVKEQFLQDLMTFYGASAYSAPFNTDTKDAINAWVNENTKGLIPTIIDGDIPSRTVMYLINALYFKDGWMDAFGHSYDGTFTASDGTEQEVEMLLGTCSDQTYIECDGVKGFEKRYDSGYKFVALMPDEGSAADLAASLTGEKLQKILVSTYSGRLTVHIPAFEADCSLDLASTLQAMGITDVFTDKADLSGMSDTRLFVSSILQKTHLGFDKYGSEAAAVTNVEAQYITSAIDPPKDEEEREIIVDRPFVYMILSGDDVPVFIGIQNSIE